MSALLLRVGTLVLAAFLVAGGLPVQGAHGDPAHVTASSHTDVVVSTATQSISFDFQNDHATAAMNSVIISVVARATNENLVFASATGTTGTPAVSWTGVTSDAGGATGHDKVTLTPPTGQTLAAGAKLTIVMSFVTGAHTAGTQLPVTVDGFDGTNSVGATTLTLSIKAAAMTVSKAATTIAEGGTDTFTVALDARPTGAVRLDLSSSNADLSLDKSTLSFTTATWATAQTVTLTAVNDAETAARPSRTITISVNEANSAVEYDAVAEKAIAVNVLDDERISLIVDPVAITIGERADNRTATFTVKLKSAPTADVTVVVARSSGTAIDADVTYTPPEKELLFTPSTWQIAKTVTITAVDDSFSEGDETLVLALTATATSAPEFKDVAATVTVTITDDDTVGIKIVETGLGTTTSEDGSTDTVTVELTTQPVTDVYLDLSVSQVGEIAFSKDSGIKFTKLTWDTPQTITITGVDDSTYDGPQKVAVAFRVDDSRSHVQWQALPNQILNVTNLDDEYTVYATPQTMSVQEGETESYNVTLSRQPTDDVVVGIKVPAGANSTQKNLTFTANNWDEPQVVSIAVTEDGKKQGDRVITVMHNVTSDDTDYAVTVPQSVAVTVVDDERVDIASANARLQPTVKVTPAGDSRKISWDVDVIEVEPAGVQVWRASSPYQVIASFANNSIEYVREQFLDNSGNAGSLYVVTAYYAETVEGGFFSVVDDLNQAPNYQGRNDKELANLGLAVADDKANVALLISIIVAVIIIAVIVIIIVRARKQDAEVWADEWDDGSDDPRTQTWREAGWQIKPSRKEPEPVFATSQAAWSEAEDNTWAAPSDDASAVAMSEADPAPDASATTEWPDAPEQAPLDDETFHLTCPDCQHDFTAEGQRPLATECPSCGVTGTLR